jgi:TolB-like protein/DNA-binding winged helix-turn-helix (wHTH) protein/Flp pilus assembly protein TadD
MPSPAMERYAFGPYRMDTGERLLHRDEQLVPLPPKAADTLLILVQNAGRMVDKGTLMEAVWPATFVEEGVLARNISLLRKTLGDTAETSTFIETIPKRGYRFIASVHTLTAESAESQNGHGLPLGPADQPMPPVSPGKARFRIPKRLAVPLLAVPLIAISAFLYFSRARDPLPDPPALRGDAVLAVMPFRSIERDDSQSYFADGMTQALISSLANLHNLKVVSLASEAGARQDAAAWAAVVRDRSVRHVLTGTILRSGSRVRVDAQLIEPASHAIRWANSYQGDAGNVLAVESDIAEAIATEIQVNVTSQEKQRIRQRNPSSPEAVDAYLQGRYFWNRRTEDSLRRAIRYFQQAIQADPKYALAYTGIADSYSLLGSVGTDGMPPNEAMPLAKTAALKALELDPELSDAHVSLAYVLLSYEWDLRGAAREFSRALALNPNSATGRHWYSHYFMAAGDLSRATQQMREALQLEPLSPSINIGVGWCHYYSRQYDQAIERFRSVAETDPSIPLAHQTLGMAYQQTGRFDQAIEEYKRAAAFSNNSPASVAALAGAYAANHKPVEARNELAHLEEMARTRYVPAFYFATVHYAMGDPAKTFEWGWKAIGERCDYLLYLGVEPRVGRLAAHPEFIRAMGALHRK